ncbi:MAG: site-specific integrase, partial [Pseudomonadota bacterium]
MSQRFGRGKKPMAAQARELLAQHIALTSRHAAKQSLGVKGSRTTGQIHSVRTHQKYLACLTQAGQWARTETGLGYLSRLPIPVAQAYLEKRVADGIGQKQLDADRNALEFITGRGSLARVRALTPPTRTSRAYTPEQAAAIAAHQRGENALSTQIAFDAGLRAHELFTLQRADEAAASGHRRWRADRFAGRAGVRYVVVGKGGLRREVLLDRALADRLEARRLDTPRAITDRGVHYVQHYAISGGKRWSQSVADAAHRVLGWSTGAHGLRHSYAQRRLLALQDRGVDYESA